MKTTSLLLFTLILFNLGYSQIEIREEIVVNAPVLKPELYDSLTPITYNYTKKVNSDYSDLTPIEVVKRNDEVFKKHIGQSIYFIPTNYINSDLRYTYFYSKNNTTFARSKSIYDENQQKITTRKQIYPTQKKYGHIPKNVTYEQFIHKDTVLSVVETNVYKPTSKYFVQGLRGNKEIEEDRKALFFTPYKEIEGKYFKIIDLEFDKSYEGTSKIKFIVTNDVNDTLYFYNSRGNLREGVEHFMLIGYYEKLITTNKNDKFIYAPDFYKTGNNYYSSTITQNSYRDINTGVELDLTNSSIWTCKSIQLLKIEREFYLQLYYILSNEENNEIKVKRQVIENYFVEKNKYDKEVQARKLDQAERERIRQAYLKDQLALKQKNEKDIIHKYGSFYGKLINENKVVLGMSKEVCQLSWGKPRDINKTIVTNLVHEQWVYSLKTYLYFENGILTGIQK